MGRTDAIKSFSCASTKTNSINLLSGACIRFALEMISGPDLILGGGRPVVRLRFEAPRFVKSPHSPRSFQSARFLPEKPIKIGPRRHPCRLRHVSDGRARGLVADVDGTPMPIARLHAPLA